MIYHLNYQYNEELLYDELLKADEYSTFIDPLTNNCIPEWKICKKVGQYSTFIANDFKYMLGCEVSPRYYIQNKGFTLPFHKDRGTQCCINFVLSTSKDPILFKIGNEIIQHEYKLALVDVQTEHMVKAVSENRCLFKLSIFDISYNEAFESIADCLSK